MTDAEAASIGERFLARTLPRAEWTHAAHLVAAVYLFTQKADVDPDRDMPGLIRAYNASVGAPSDRLHGYHETLTRFWLAAVSHFLSRADEDQGLGALASRLVASPLGSRDLPFSFYSHERLFSLEAKERFVPPDLAALDFSALTIDPA